MLQKFFELFIKVFFTKIVLYDNISKHSFGFLRSATGNEPSWRLRYEEQPAHHTQERTDTGPVHVPKVTNVVRDQRYYTVADQPSQA